jgi:hypothetical protein
MEKEGGGIGSDRISDHWIEGGRECMGWSYIEQRELSIRQMVLVVVYCLGLMSCFFLLLFLRITVL